MADTIHYPDGHVEAMFGDAEANARRLIREGLCEDAARYVLNFIDDLQADMTLLEYQLKEMCDL